MSSERKSDRTRPRVFLSLGSNLNDREHSLRQALTELEKRGAMVLVCSALYETEPLEVLDQPDFLNIVVEVDTALSPQELLAVCLETENALGRKRIVRKGPRSIDIDLLFHGSAVMTEDELTLPHPRLRERNFVLAPLAEIAPEFIDPVSRRTVAQLLADSPDRSRVKRVGAISVSGAGGSVIGMGK